MNNEIVAKVEALDIRLIRYLYCDLAGVIRGKTVHASQFPKKLAKVSVLLEHKMQLIF